MKRYVADLHVHTCLSPCGDLQMSPRKIVETALSRDIDIIAICDHNSCENVMAVMRAAAGGDLTVLPGMEVTSQEEVHLVALFENLEDALALQKLIYDHLQGENNQEAFGMQVVVNEFSEVLGFNKKLLIGAADLSINELVSSIHRHAGLAIASHIDREGFGIIGQLGYIPKDVSLDALEVSPRMAVARAQREFSEYSGYAFISSSDAHFLEQIGRGTTSFFLQGPHLSEIKKALRREDGRMIIH
jgi:PHP family Zn ribbon phosphoesterase